MMSGVEPQITIKDQIYNQRFRYGNENRSGKRHSTDYTMTVGLENVPAGFSMKIFCVNCNGAHHPHPNTLSGNNCVEGVYCHPPFSSFIRTQDIQIPWLQITRTVKKEMLSEMEKRQKLLPPEFQSQGQAVLDQLKQEKNTIKSTQICLCVHLSGSVDPDHPYNIFQVSRPIKHVEKGKCLMIDELSHTSAPVLGQLVTHIFTSENSPPIEEGKIDVRIEEKDEEGNLVWSSDPFVAGKEDIKYKHVICYPVPEFRDKTVIEPVNVNLILRCLCSQKEVSIPFTYKPNPDAVMLGRKRKASWSSPALERPAQKCPPAAAFDSVSSLNQTDMENGLPNGSNSGKQASENIVMSNATIEMTSPCEVTSQMSCKKAIVHHRCVDKLELELVDDYDSVSNMNQTDNENENGSQNGSNPGTQSSESAVMSNNLECKREESLTEEAPVFQQNFNLSSLPSADFPDPFESEDLFNFLNTDIFLPETDSS